MSLDINTPRGEVTKAQERRLAEIITKRWPQTSYLHTPKDTSADIDVVLASDNIVRAVGQASCRNMTLLELQKNYCNEWLLTYDKLLKASQLAIAMCVPYWGLLYLVPEDKVLRVKMFTPEEGWLVTFRVAKTKTQATCNGGTALRDNAFIRMSTAHIIHNRENADGIATVSKEISTGDVPRDQQRRVGTG